ncbi:Spy/CpxP family protein refolding chaperone [Thermosediminibacter litoriperuensis]|uniref:Spy/CpxP family protein refolding chaperone n=1 Tax=Thermosediminibacter litoriperuensis TaxID=291989 RepID=A0A5S5AY78_9FIRM|nr:Spy/CpxP family protein refolding chaperone [Thermosediminibacter litoriperuensis]TYP58820.1 Spy/CpxP family protein refolding chaperone [Thermosediminibacter litoriperuensis]
MSKKIVALGVMAVIILGAAAMAMAAGPGGQRTAGVNPPTLPQLNLTDEQYSRLKEIRTEFYQKMIELRNEMDKKHFELQDLYFSKNPDQDAVQAKFEELKDLRDKMFNLKKEYSEKMKNVLTEDQLSQLRGFRGPVFGMGPGFCHGFGPGKMGRFFGPEYDPGKTQ